MAYKIWLFLWYFVLASFCGWVAEVGYIGMVYRKFKNPGMLNGPYCPQYGLMIALPWAALTALHWQTSFVATLFFCLIQTLGDQGVGVFIEHSDILWHCRMRLRLIIQPGSWCKFI